MLSLLLVMSVLTACSFGGILVAPTAPSREPTVSQSQTQETTSSNRTDPTVSTKMTFPATQPAATEPTVPQSQTQETDLPNRTEPTAFTQTTVPVTRPPLTEPAMTQNSTASPATTAPHVTTPSIPSTHPTDLPVTEPVSGGERHDPRQPGAYTVSAAEQALLDQIQEMRAKRQLPMLAEDKTLGGLAYLRSYEIVTHFKHVRPDDRGYATVFSDYGCTLSASGETILKCEDWYPAAYVLKDWLSSGTTANVLTDPTFTHVGVGIYEQNGMQYIVCLVTAQ